MDEFILSWCGWICLIPFFLFTPWKEEIEYFSISPSGNKRVSIAYILSQTDWKVTQPSPPLCPVRPNCCPDYFRQRVAWSQYWTIRTGVHECRVWISHLLSVLRGLLVGGEQHQLLRLGHRQRSVCTLAAARNLVPELNRGYKNSSQKQADSMITITMSGIHVTIALCASLCPSSVS